MSTLNPTPHPAPVPPMPAPPARLNSHDLLQQARTVEIEHDGKIYELRVTRLNKLILTA
jgi:hemin uptake protein HemP